MIAPSHDFWWLEERTGMHFSGAARAISNFVDGEIAAMVAFDRWTKNAAHIHMAASSPLAVRALIKPAFTYAFRDCGKGLLLAEIPHDNYRSLRLATWLGFKDVRWTKDGWAEGIDMVNLELRREDCRWLEVV